MIFILLKDYVLSDRGKAEQHKQSHPLNKLTLILEFTWYAEFIKYYPELDN